MRIADAEPDCREDNLQGPNAHRSRLRVVERLDKLYGRWCQARRQDDISSIAQAPQFLRRVALRISDRGSHTIAIARPAIVMNAPAGSAL